MREIKFRALAAVNDKHNNIKVGDFVYGSYIESGVDAPCIIFGDGEQIEVDRKTLGQITGLSDIIGADIYEGDIISFMCDDEVYNREVKYDDGGFCVNLNHEMIPNEYCPYLGEVGIESVLGNIHKNPDFLCAKK